MHTALLQQRGLTSSANGRKNVRASAKSGAGNDQVPNLSRCHNRTILMRFFYGRALRDAFGYAGVTVKLVLGRPVSLGHPYDQERVSELIQFNSRRHYHA